VLVAMSGYGRTMDVVRTAEAGFDLHLLKPVDPLVLSQLGMLLRRADAAFERARLLVEETRLAALALLRQQLKMAWTYIDLADGEENREMRNARLARALHLCERVSTRAHLIARNQEELYPDIDALWRRLSATD
jgi:DNA-binding response OmpR family regulator